MKTKEEILKDYESFKYTENGCDETHYYKDNVLLAMEEYAAQPKWISVEERLPTELVEVLVYPEWNEIPVQAYLKNGVWKGSVETTEMMKDGYVNDREFINIKITHWMPLPTAPEK